MREFFQACGDAALAGAPADSVPAAHYDLIRAGAEKFAAAIAEAPDLDYRPNTVPAAEGWSDSGTEIGKQFGQLASEMPWCPGRGDPKGLRSGLIFVNDMFDLGDVRAGLLYLGANNQYPEHKHRPQEMYIMLDGTAEWRFGGSDQYQLVPPGRTIYNSSLDLHGIRAGEASLSMWVLWGEGV